MSEIFRAHELASEYSKVGKEIYDLIDNFVKFHILPVAVKKGYTTDKKDSFPTWQKWEMKKEQKYLVEVEVNVGEPVYLYSKPPCIILRGYHYNVGLVDDKKRFLDLNRPSESFEEFLEDYENILYPKAIEERFG